ncbi:glutathione S-transferase family protein [Antarcticirhabdus aurantiaca]|uniref:Glutathione S-transferase family protein n=1 Tax=Antarcticirhabdus aurantiaca TaxID=2606717 RepID=A0ACD4NUU1_9HYPH|nr:glutathione S-transferase family protein [Antarcticirhabdus aurantiaca]WAJ30538.1 glutathione S-transferase family protein [Jeongeuplla avenae]
MADIKLWGFNNSTYVRTVRMVLHEKGVTDYEQVPLNVMKGEPQSAEHRQRHPFGKVPVLDHGDFRIIETAAIAQYLDTVLSGPSVIPSDPKDRARMDMAVCILDSYGYGALIGGVAAYHLFPDFVGGKNEEGRAKGVETGRTVLETIMRIKNDSPWIAGEAPSVADFFLAPILAYVAMTPDKDELLGVAGVSDWWARVQDLEAFRATPYG